NPFRIRTYKKTGEGGPRPATPLPKTERPPTTRRAAGFAPTRQLHSTSTTVHGSPPPVRGQGQFSFLLSCHIVAASRSGGRAHGTVVPPQILSHLARRQRRCGCRQTLRRFASRRKWFSAR